MYVYYACLSTGSKKEKGKMLGKLEVCAHEMQSPEIPLGKEHHTKAREYHKKVKEYCKRAGMYPSSI
jgi:hypothetical protein